MNYSQKVLFDEWISKCPIDNDCPFDFEIVGDWSEPITDESCTLKFTPKEEEKT